MLKIADHRSDHDPKFDLDVIAREGARRMLVAALEAEVTDYIDKHQQRDEDGKALVVRNGKANTRRVTLGAGTVEVRAPRVNDKRVDDAGGRQRFTSQILPPYMRRSPKVAEVFPVLYLRGLSTGDFKEALPVLLGEDASGLSSTAIARLTNEWEKEYHAFIRRDLSDRDFVYVWVDGIVRHEAPLIGRDERTRWRPVAAGRRKLGAAGPREHEEKAESSPDNDGMDWHYQTVQVRQAR